MSQPPAFPPPDGSGSSGAPTLPPSGGTPAYRPRSHARPEPAALQPSPSSSQPQPQPELPQTSQYAPIALLQDGAPPPGFGYPQYAPPTIPKPGNVFAWALAFSPLLGVLVTVIFLIADSADSAIVTACFAAVAAVGIALAVLDVYRVRAVGVKASMVLAILLIPAYLFVRASRLRRGFAIPITWCVMFVVAIAGVIFAPQLLGVPLDVALLETSISTEIENQAGVTVDVECPDGVSARPDETFSCTATATDGSVLLIDVTVQNTRGDVLWEVRG